MAKYVTAIRTNDGDKKIDFDYLANRNHAKYHKSGGEDPITPEDIGAFPIIEANSEDYDMDEILKGESHYKIYRVGTKTKGTPAKTSGEGMVVESDFNYGLIISTSNGQHGQQTAFLCGASCLFHRTMKTINNVMTITKWQEIYSENNIPTLTELGAAKEKHVSQHYSNGADPIKPSDIGAYTKAEVLSSSTATSFGLAATAQPKDVFQEIYKIFDNGVSKIGDTITTARTDLGSDWLLCDGGISKAASYPELKKLYSAPGKRKMITSSYTYYPIDIAYYNGTWVVALDMYNSSKKQYLPYVFTTKDTSGAWTFVKLSDTADIRVKSVCCGNGTWAVLCYNSSNKTNYVYTTTTPATAASWSVSNVGDSMRIAKLCYYNNVWVGYDSAASPSNYIWTTNNPIGNWVKNTNLKSSNYYKVYYNNKIWVLLDKSSTYDSKTETYTYYVDITTTSDITGSSFTTTQLNTDGTNITPNDVCYNGKTWVITGYSGSNSKYNHYIYTSTSASGEWALTDVSDKVSTKFASMDVVYCNNKWVFSSASTFNNGTYIYTTTDLTKTWTEEELSNSTDVVNGRAIACSDDTYVVVGICDTAPYVFTTALIQRPNIALDRVKTYIRAK